MAAPTFIEEPQRAPSPTMRLTKSANGNEAKVIPESITNESHHVGLTNPAFSWKVEMAAPTFIEEPQRAPSPTMRLTKSANGNEAKVIPESITNESHHVGLTKPAFSWKVEMAAPTFIEEPQRAPSPTMRLTKSANGNE